MTTQRIDGHLGWYQMARDALLNDVKGYIAVGLSKQRALDLAFCESAASKTIKHEIENAIMRHGAKAAPVKGADAPHCII